MINENEKPSVLGTLSKLGKSPFFLAAVGLYVVFVILSVVTFLDNASVPEEYNGVMGIDVGEIVIRLIAVAGFIFTLLALISAKKNRVLTGLTILKGFCAVYGVYTVLDSVLTSIMTTESLPDGISIPFLFGGTLDIDYVILIPCIEIYLTVLRVAFYFMVSGFLERIAQSIRTDEAMPNEGVSLFVIMMIVAASNIISTLFNFVIDGWLGLEIIMYTVFLACLIMFGLWLMRYRAMMTTVYNSNIVITEEE